MHRSVKVHALHVLQNIGRMHIVRWSYVLAADHWLSPWDASCRLTLSAPPSTPLAQRLLPESRQRTTAVSQSQRFFCNATASPWDSAPGGEKRRAKKQETSRPQLLQHIRSPPQQVRPPLPPPERPPPQRQSSQQQPQQQPQQRWQKPKEGGWTGRTLPRGGTGAAAEEDDEGTETAPRDPAKLRRAEEKAFNRAKASAAGMLLRRPHSEAELRRKLAEREHPPDAVDAALARLQELGQQDDTEFAEILARSKWRQSRWAPSRIRMELSRKGLSPADIDSAIQSVFGEDMSLKLDFADDVIDERPVGPGTELAPETHLLECARRQLNLSRGLPPETRRRRFVMYLQRRGHSWDTISKVLQQTELAT